MNVKRIFRIFGFIILFTSVANGQWKMLKDFGAEVYSIQFLDDIKLSKIGFVGTLSGQVWRTSDGGATWALTTTPPTLIGSVRDFSFKDSLTGWLAAFQIGSTNPACYKTTDAGVSWSPLTPTGTATAIRYNKWSNLLILSQWTGAYVSNDLGTTWTIVPGTSLMNMCGIRFSDTAHGLISVDPVIPSNPAQYITTTDGGLTWATQTQTIEAWQPLEIKNTRTYFACSEATNQILRTNDFGTTWAPVSQFPAALALSGDIRGDLSVLYVQGKSGIKYSIDEGVTWVDYCGPGNDYDTRFYQLGDTLYAGTIDGQLWMNPFGVRNNKLLLQFPKQPYDLVSNGCQDVDSLLKLINLSNCLPVRISSAAIIPGPGAKQFTLKGVVAHAMKDTSSEFLKLSYSPLNSFPDSATLEIKYSVGGAPYTMDIRVRGFVKSGFNVNLSKDLNLLLSSDCSKVDTFVTVKSGLCAPDTILNVAISDPTAFVVTKPTFPTPIDAGASLKIPISVKSLPSGTYSAKLTLTIRSGGITKDTIINLSASILSATDPRTNLSSATEKFDTTSVCGEALDTIVLKNTICKKLFIKNISISPALAASEFQIANASLFPDSLAQNDTAIAIIRYKPTVGGKISGTLCFTIGFDLNSTKDTCIAISGIGKALPAAGLSDSLIQFPKTIPCQSQSATTQLFNNGCGIDTIIGTVAAKDAAFSIGAVINSVIPSGGSQTLTLQEDPLSSGSKFDSVGLVIHSSTGSLDTIYIKLAGIVSQPVHQAVLITKINLDSLPPCVPGQNDQLISNSGTCDTLTITQMDITGPNWITISNPPLPQRIVPGGNFKYTILTNPGAKAVATATIHIKGNGIDTIVTIQVSTATGGAVLTLTSADSLFVSSLCRPAVRTFTLQNSSCDPVTLDKLQLGGSAQFSFTQTTPLPAVIPAGASIDIKISFDPNVIGDSLGSLTYQSTTSGVSRTISLRGSRGTSLQTVQLRLTSGGATSATVKTGSLFTLDLELVNAIDPTLGLNDVKATLSYMPDILGRTGATVTGGNGWNIISENPPNANGNLTLDIQPNGNAGLGAGAKVASIVFEAFVAPVAQTPIDLQVKFNESDPTFMSCVLAPQSPALPFNFSIDPSCGDTVLRGFMNGNLALFKRIVIRPNPVSEGGQIAIGIEMLREAEIHFTLTDALGREVARQTKSVTEIGQNNFSLDIPKGASGLYILSIESQGHRETSKIVIER
ncbi:MAG: choice-of-anchor D domain-containing protein [bacterium]